METAKVVQRKCRIVEEGGDLELEVAWDDVSGAELDPQGIRRAREEEIEYIRKMNLHEKVQVQ